MAAGLGFKTFTTGEVLTSADVNGYLMQGVLVFASEVARDAAITSPQEGQFAYTKDNNSLWYYTGSAWAASGATGDIEGVTAGTGISGGGTSGTVTITNSMATEIDAKGDLIVGTGADAFARLAVGTNGHTLVADSVETTGLKWVAPAGGALPTARARPSTAQTISANTYTKVTLGTEDWDTDNCFANSRFTASIAGYYLVNAEIAVNSGASGIVYTTIYKNGSMYQENYFGSSDPYVILQNSTMVYLAVNDYVELYTSLNHSGGANLYSASGYVFMDVTGIRS